MMGIRADEPLDKRIYSIGHTVWSSFTAVRMHEPRVNRSKCTDSHILFAVITMIVHKFGVCLYCENGTLYETPFPLVVRTVSTMSQAVHSYKKGI